MTVYVVLPNGKVERHRGDYKWAIVRYQDCILGDGSWGKDWIVLAWSADDRSAVRISRKRSDSVRGQAGLMRTREG